MLILVKFFRVFNEDFGSRDFLQLSFMVFNRFVHVFDFTSFFRTRLENEINQIAVCSLIEVLSYPIHGED